jgi:excisionase family DNA binding protein
MQQTEILDKLNAIEQLLRGQSEKPFTFAEACKYLNCSKSYLYKLTHTKNIPHYKPNGKKVYFTKAELDIWLSRNPIKTQSQIEQEANDYVTLGKRESK